MQRFLSITLALLIGLSFSFDAEARRFGGGKSFGAAPKHRQAQPQQRQQQKQAQPQQNNAGKAAATSGAARWLGPLAGIAAGGLLASLLFGDAFEGLQIMDMLLMAGLAFLVFRLLARRRQQMQPMAAGVPMQRQMPESNLFGGFGNKPANSAPQPVMQAPAWFNADSFLTAAREHFNQLQQHWDGNEMEQIAEYVTPEMLSFLQQERASLGDGYQSTYIDNLDVQLDGVEELTDYTVATLSFTGVSKTSRFDQGETFNESWRMERRHGDNQPWLIAGIRQNA